MPNGDILMSDVTSLPSSSVPLESVTWDIVPVEFINETGNVATNDHAEIYVTTPPTDEDVFLRWRVTGEYEIIEKFFGLLNPRTCYVKQDIDNNRLFLAQTSDFLDGRIVEEPLLSLNLDTRFHIVFLFNVAQHSISRQEFEYWKTVEGLINVEGTLFDPPPGTVQGNMRNMTNPNESVFGYFSLSSLSFTRQFVDITTRGLFADTDCLSRPRANNPEKCVDCTTVARSTLERPPYWRF